MWSTHPRIAGTVLSAVSGVTDTLATSIQNEFSLFEQGAVWSHGLHSGGV